MSDGGIDDFFQSPGANEDLEGGDQSQEPPRVPPRLGLLAELNTEEFDEVARAAKLTFVPEHTTVFRQGDEADRFFIVVDGSVQVARDGEILATLCAGSFFGEGALLVGGRRSATVTTLVPSSIWSIDYTVFDSAVSHHLLADDSARVETQRRITQTPPDAFDG